MRNPKIRIDTCEKKDEVEVSVRRKPNARVV